MSDNPGLFGGADVVGIGWGTKPADASQRIDTAALRTIAGLYADRFASAGAAAYAACAGEAPLCPAEIPLAAADDLDTSRGEATALRKAVAEQARRLDAYRRAKAGEE